MPLPSADPSRSSLRPLIWAVWGVSHASLLSPLAWAAETPALPEVVVDAALSNEASLGVSGWVVRPRWQSPVQAVQWQAQALENAQVQRLADVTKLDPSLTGAYNTTGYWSFLNIRGFTLDNATNYRRDGLPFNAETSLGLENIDAVEALKGIAGIQAGSSAPGGLVNLRIKRPDGRIREVGVALTGGSSVKAVADLGDRFGEGNAFAWRLNAATERLSPDVQATPGQRHLMALASQWKPSVQTKIDLEFEHSEQRQPSVPGFSALGPVLPSAKAIDPRINLNQQTWTLPVESKGSAGSLRWQQNWATDWTSIVSYGVQRLKTNDRAAFPYGCDAEGIYDRFCSDGSFDLYDYRSDNEMRVTRALQAQLNGRWQWGGVSHDLSWGVLHSRYSRDVSMQAYNFAIPVGAGASVWRPDTPHAPDATQRDPSTDVLERSTEWSWRDTITISPEWRSWMGVRHSRYLRRSTPTDGAAPTEKNQGITTPWVALGYTFRPQMQWYISWGEGAEVFTAPRGRTALNPGEIMPVVKSRQVEMGIQSGTEDRQWGVSAFRIARPEMASVSSRYQLDGSSVHQGVEAYWQERQGAWQWSAGAMWLDAKRRGSADASINGLRPTNVPAQTLKGSVTYKWPADTTGAWKVSTSLDLVHEGTRWADRANTLKVSSWQRVDMGLSAIQPVGTQAVHWRLGVSNVFDTRAWRESPNNFGHIWLFPMAPRTWTASMQYHF